VEAGRSLGTTGLDGDDGLEDGDLDDDDGHDDEDDDGLDDEDGDLDGEHDDGHEDDGDEDAPCLLRMSGQPSSLSCGSRTK